jgi:hypothetical protein
VTVFTGDQGYVDLRRGTETSPSVSDLLVKGDVNAVHRRFGLQNQSITNGYYLITGDRVEVFYGTKKQRKPLDAPWLLKNHTDANGKWYPDWTGYVGIDAMGSVRLFDTYSKSLQNKGEEALELEVTEAKEYITFQQRNPRFRCLANVRSYEFTTERETIDISRLGDVFRKKFESGMISGQGSLDCLWSYKPGECDGTANSEFSFYLSQLCLRVATGAKFTGRFVLHFSGNESVFYEAECIVTNASIEVNTENAIASTIQFVTTGVIQLRVGQVPGALLQDDPDPAPIDYLVLQEDDDPIYLEQ